MGLETGQGVKDILCARAVVLLWGILFWSASPPPLTWLSSQVEGCPCAGCRRLAGPHCVFSFRVHVELDCVFPFGNLERKQNRSVLLPHLENKSTAALWHSPVLEHSKTGLGRGPAVALEKRPGSGEPPPNLPCGTAAVHKLGCFPAEQSCPLPAGAGTPTQKGPDAKPSALPRWQMH